MKPTIPKGTRDFLPGQVYKRDFIFRTIREVFRRYGYQPIETPVMESLATLTGKYGEEGDRLLFKVLNNGDFMKKVDDGLLQARDSQKIISSISKRGLRYDLTVPFARYVVMHQNDLHFPFKRYHIAPVWRADRPQKGRYQEFYQCDVDVVGSQSLSYEAELAKIYDEVFVNLGIKVIIKINHRKVLLGIAEAAGIKDQFMAMTVAMDKLDKIGKDRVIQEMKEKDIPHASAEKVLEMIKIKDLDALEIVFDREKVDKVGIEELREFYRYFDLAGSQNKVVFDLSLARGLGYYTGCIFEVVADEEAYSLLRMGSLGGGGRYADLTGIFGLKDMPGVGISFGAERIYDVMEEMGLFPRGIDCALDVLVMAMDSDSHKKAFEVVQGLRNQGIIADLYPEPVKMKKQMKYANAMKVPHVIVIGSEEVRTRKYTLKNMDTGEQKVMTVDEIVQRLKNQ